MIKDPESLNRSIILALDTSAPQAGFALARGGETLAAFTEPEGRPHSQTLFANLDRLLTAASIGLHEIDLFAAVTGPGSFTGLRVGLAALQGLADAAGKPTLGADTLTLLALAVPGEGLRLITWSAGRHEIYGGLREVAAGGGVRMLGEDLVGGAGDVREALSARLEGRAALLLREAGGEPAAAGEAEIDRGRVNLAEVLARCAPRLGREPGREPLQAHYVRPSDAEIRAPREAAG